MEVENWVVATVVEEVAKRVVVEVVVDVEEAA